MFGLTGCLTYLWVEKDRKSLFGHSWVIKRFEALSRPHTIRLMPEQDMGSIFSSIFDPKNCLKSARYDAQSDVLFGVTTHYRTFPLTFLLPFPCSVRCLDWRSESLLTIGLSVFNLPSPYLVRCLVRAKVR